MFLKFERYGVNGVMNDIKNVVCLPSGVSLKKLDILSIKEKLNSFLNKSNIKWLQLSQLDQDQKV